MDRLRDKILGNEVFAVNCETKVNVFCYFEKNEWMGETGKEHI